MPPRPIDSLGSIFSPNPQYLSNCSVRASVLPSPGGVQLFWVTRPGEGLFASVRQAEKQKSPPALSRPRPAICRAISELCHHLRETDNTRILYRSETTGIEFPRDFASTLVPETIQFYVFFGKNVYSTMYSQAVTHPSTNMAQCCLTSVIGRELVLST